MRKSFNKEIYSIHLSPSEKKQEKANFYFNVAKNVNTIRLKKKISVYDLSAMTHTEAAYISRLENGKKNISLFHLYEFSKVFGVSMDDFMPHNTENKFMKDIKNILYGCSHRELEEIRSYLKTNYEHKEL